MRKTLGRGIVAAIVAGGMSACSQVAAGTSPVSGPAASSSPVTGTAVRLCGGDPVAARIVAVYRAMLLAVDGGDITSASRLYVSRNWVDGSPGDAQPPTGALEPTVQACFQHGVAGLPAITMVTGWDDPAVPKEGSPPLPSIAHGGRVVSFGNVTAGNQPTSSLTVNRGGGQVVGGQYLLEISGGSAHVVRPLSQWIS